MDTIAQATDLTGVALDGMERAGALTRETIMNEKRHWVRIARACDNKCIFCHDADVQNGTFLDVEDCKAEFRRGRENGATRLIISGGEASIHPQFIDLIRYGKQELGFEKVQTITNGRMFGRHEFAEAALEAGLDEATFSIHSHIPSLSEYLSGAKNYHIKAVKGLLHLLRSGRCIINMDIVIQKLNYKMLPEMIHYWTTLGVREYDLLYLVPFGRAMHEESPNLFFEAADLRPYLVKTLKYARKHGLVIWTNRLPPPVLEGFEKYIQDPHKIETEMWGRYREFRRGLDALEPPSCYGDSCPECYVRDLCGNMQRDNLILNKSAFEHVVGDATEETLDAGAEEHRRKVVRQAENFAIRARSVREANRYAEWDDVLPDAITMRLETMERFEELAPELADRLCELTVSTGDALAAILATEQDFALNVELTKESIWWLTHHMALLQATGRKLRFSWPNTEKLSESVATHASVEEMAAIATAAECEVENIPPCLSGGKEYTQPVSRFDLDLVQPDGKIDIVHYANHYIRNDYYTKSLRCRKCVHDAVCPGVHINIVRNFGYQILKPMTEEKEANVA